MDLLHISPISKRVATHSNEIKDYESSGECISVYGDKDDITSSMDISDTSEKSICNNNSDYNMSDTRNNYNNNLILSDNNRNNCVTKDSPLVTKTCRLDQTFNMLNDVQQTNDIESQKLGLNRKKSIIYRLYSNRGSNRCNRISTRLSILGKPIPLHRMRNDVNFYKEKIAVYNFFQRPQGFIAVGYHIFVSFVVFICLVLTIYSTISDYEKYAIYGLKYMDSFIAALFGSEFMARFWSSSCVSHYQGWKGKLRFLRNPFRIIDVFVIITSIVVLFFDTKGHNLIAYFRGLRFFQVFQMLRLEHRFRPWKLMASVVWAQREHLAITTYMGFLALLFISFAIYFVEKDVNPQFSSIATSMWWGVVTLCTVGYGDMYPVTATGKFLSCVCIIVGVSIFALPAGILGTGLALKVQEQQRNRQMTKRREPAAKLIQWTWRCYAASQNSTSIITWRLHIRPNTKIESLTNEDKNAIRFLRTVKYFIARRNFNRALKPYDIKDVLEQYAAGHADVLGRVKYMQSRLTTVQTSVNNNIKVFQDSTVILSSRMTQIETATSDMQMKLNQLIDSQLRDRIIIETLASLLNQRDKCDNCLQSYSPSEPSFRMRANSL